MIGEEAIAINTWRTGTNLTDMDQVWRGLWLQLGVLLWYGLHRLDVPVPGHGHDGPVLGHGHDGLVIDTK